MAAKSFQACSGFQAVFITTGTCTQTGLGGAILGRSQAAGDRAMGRPATRIGRIFTTTTLFSIGPTKKTKGVSWYAAWEPGRSLDSVGAGRPRDDFARETAHPSLARRVHGHPTGNCPSTREWRIFWRRAIRPFSIAWAALCLLYKIRGGPGIRRGAAASQEIRGFLEKKKSHKALAEI